LAFVEIPPPPLGESATLRCSAGNHLFALLPSRISADDELASAFSLSLSVCKSLSPFSCAHNRPAVLSQYVALCLIVISVVVCARGLSLHCSAAWARRETKILFLLWVALRYGGPKSYKRMSARARSWLLRNHKSLNRIAASRQTGPENNKSEFY